MENILNIYVCTHKIRLYKYKNISNSKNLIKKKLKGVGAEERQVSWLAEHF